MMDPTPDVFRGDTTAATPAAKGCYDSLLCFGAVSSHVVNKRRGSFVLKPTKKDFSSVKLERVGRSFVRESFSVANNRGGRCPAKIKRSCSEKGLFSSRGKANLVLPDQTYESAIPGPDELYPDFLYSSPPRRDAQPSEPRVATVRSLRRCESEAYLSPKKPSSRELFPNALKSFKSPFTIRRSIRNVCKVKSPIKDCQLRPSRDPLYEEILANYPIDKTYDTLPKKSKCPIEVPKPEPKYVTNVPKPEPLYVINVSKPEPNYLRIRPLPPRPDEPPVSQERLDNLRNSQTFNGRSINQIRNTEIDKSIQPISSRPNRANARASCETSLLRGPAKFESYFPITHEDKYGNYETNRGIFDTYSCVATKDLWYNKLTQAIAEERDKEPPSTTIQVTYYDPLNNTDICKTVSISATTTARECISLVLAHLELPAQNEEKFQLWVKSPNEESPYPLIGHELPLSIKMNCLREILQECDAEQCGNLYNTDIMGRCQFILRQERKPMSHNMGLIDSPDGGKKVSKKARKSPIRIHKVFKRSNSKGDVTEGAPQPPVGGFLFAQNLDKICEPDGSLPKPIMNLFHQLFQKGPFTVGIFRKSANARVVRELKEKMDSGEDIPDIDNVHIMAIAALLKDFLRSLPDCLLCADLYEEWLEVPRLPSARDRVSRTLLLCSRLPRPHLTLLKHFLCVLHHIARRAAENMMSASNLAVCVGPSILWPSSPILALSPEASKQAPATVEFLIERCCSIFGKDVLSLFGIPPETDPLRQDSGAEESDSLHSLHSGHSMHSSVGMRRDDSSIDSLERELLNEGELSPLPRKDKMSLTNLSRDSGLTMSDSQLYTPDEEESGSTSSSHSGEKNYSHTHQQDRPNERFQHYSAPNNPNAIYTAVYKRPEKIQNTYDEPDSYYAAPSREHTRVHVTYSSPNYNNYGTQSPSKEYNRIYKPSNDNIKYQMEEEEAIYSVPGGVNSQHMLPFVASSNFQRHDWTRRCSNLKKVSKSSCGEGGLMRSTSEESLLNKYNAPIEYGVSLGAAGNSGAGSMEYFSKGRALPPTPIEQHDTVIDYNSLGGRDSPLRRSKSAHQMIEASEKRLSLSPERIPEVAKPIRRDNVKWHRSRSVPQIHEEGDRSYDSSTLSDDDSTPHVSRSNSRGKECGSNNLQAWDSSDSHNSRNSSFKSERTGSMCTVVSAGSTSTLASNPPSYEETLNRRSLMNNKAQTMSPKGIPDYAIREEKMKSAKAKQLYEESLRIYEEENTYPCDLVRASPAHAHDSDDASEVPPPLPPKCEPPPLPPKQKSSRKSNDGSSRLKHLPPVHVEISSRKARSVTSLPANQIVYDPPLHKTIIYTDDNPPILPPKERTVIEVEATNYLSHVEKKSIETQTDDCDLLEEDLRDEGIQSNGSWIGECHVTSVPVPDTSFREARRRGRARRKNSNASQRSRSMPGGEAGKNSPPECTEEGEDEWDFAGGPYDFRDLKQLDPELQQEISWSVTQLRAIFGDSLKGAKVHPPPYRPPPSAHRTPMGSYHMGAGDTFSCRKQRPHSNYGEESYV